MDRLQIGELLADRRRNAAAAWVLCAFLLVVAAESVLGEDLVWAGFVGGVLALALVPPAAFRDATVMLPWEVLAMAALPVLGKALATVQLTGRLGTYFSVAALALIIAVELHVFTAVKMSHGFAILFVVVATMAAAGGWAIARWGVELAFGIPALYPELDDAATHDAVMLEFVSSTVAGLLAGVVFELYFRRRAPAGQWFPGGAA